ncbi:hypothetical protein HPB47_013978 [Ixodes persulcatus]|uniref:Uncharacterized protein n=1 Tax=Ixodes persulcatus TaxID=34615 RepID=A0AC60R0U3_IXOPE|nr:hypothetical protein HPB47_013978 [Ixodes persulcatus]
MNTAFGEAFHAPWYYTPIARVCGAIRFAIDRHFPPSSGVKIIAEPGQFFVTAAYSLVVRVVGKRQREISIDDMVIQISLWLHGADRLVWDPEEVNPHGILEVKCPYSVKDTATPPTADGLCLVKNDSGTLATTPHPKNPTLQTPYHLDPNETYLHQDHYQAASHGGYTKDSSHQRTF